MKDDGYITISVQITVGKNMFANLSDKLTQTVKRLRGLHRISEENIQETLREIRLALLDADVALPVVRQFVEHIRDKALGQEVMQSLSPGQALIKIVHDELIAILGETYSEINLKTNPPAVILMAGLQGSGKTTSSAKLAKWLKEKHNKSILLASTDVYRPAAIEQLKILAEQVGVDFLVNSSDKPLEIAQQALNHAKNKIIDVVIIDTAGRLHIDEDMMAEIKAIHHAVTPIETLFVVDSMTGQDAANTAKAFHDALALTGVILTKTDGDARGGAALSVKMITGKPVKFMGIGEKIEAFSPFYPDRIASRILDMGDVLTLIEEVEQKIDKQKAEKLAKKLKKGKSFDLEDFRDQLLQMKKMGGMMNLISKLPGIGQLPQNIKSQMDESILVKIEAIINSMTPKERAYPDLIKGSRKIRIANGSGTQVQDVNRLLKQFDQMQRMMKKMTRGGNMMKMMRNLQNMMPNQF